MSLEMTTIVVGYLPTAAGAAALDHAKKWAVANSARLLMAAPDATATTPTPASRVPRTRTRSRLRWRKLAWSTK